MKVLIITYYWPPAGGSGVQRWLKFVKYLRDFEVEPVVYCPQNPSYPILDASLSDEIPEGIEVIRQKIFEPNQFLSRKKKHQSGGFLKSNPNFFNRFLQFVRANFFIPDARKHWVKPSVRFLEDYLLKNSIDVIITTGPPHSLHLIGRRLQQRMKLKWIADFRDPWTEIDYFHQLPLTKNAMNKHYQLEREVVSKADAVLVVGNSMKSGLGKFSQHIHVLTNGYDNFMNSEKIVLDKKFSLVHVGLMNADRNPIVLWDALRELLDENKGLKDDLSINLIGSLSEEVHQSLTKFDPNLIHKIPYLSHNDVRKYQLSSQVLLLCINKVPAAKGIVTGKIFEYLQAKRPILAIGPEDGDAAEILKNTKSGICIDFENKDALKNHILALYNAFKKGKLEVNSVNTDQYHRKELTKKLVEIIKDTVNS